LFPIHFAQTTLSKLELRLQNTFSKVSHSCLMRKQLNLKKFQWNSKHNRRRRLQTSGVRFSIERLSDRSSVAKWMIRALCITSLIQRLGKKQIQSNTYICGSQPKKVTIYRRKWTLQPRIDHPTFRLRSAQRKACLIQSEKSFINQEHCTIATDLYQCK